jgi:brefeldin A-resistance guanine nucleotide exchange factor 1
MLTPVGLLLTNESVCEILQSTFRICFETRLSDLLRKTAELALNDMIQLLFTRLPTFSEENLPLLKKLKMRNSGSNDNKTKRKRAAKDSSSSSSSETRKQKLQDQKQKLQQQQQQRKKDISPTPTKKPEHPVEPEEPKTGKRLKKLGGKFKNCRDFNEPSFSEIPTS